MSITGLTPRSRAYHFGPTQHADHFVYRCYDADDVLLYIGCTHEVTRRINAHQRAGTSAPKASQWLAACMVRFEVEGPYKGREVGRETERAAIQSEQPLFNYQERACATQAAWMTRGAIAEYLLEHGHRELAERTACQCWSDYRRVGEYDPHCAVHEHLALPEGGDSPSSPRRSGGAA